MEVDIQKLFVGICLNIILLKFKQGIVEIPFRYLWIISVLCLDIVEMPYEHCGDVHFS